MRWIVNVLLLLLRRRRRRNYDVIARHGHVSSTDIAVAVKLLLLMMMMMWKDASLCGGVIIGMISCGEWRHIHHRVRLHTVIVQHSGGRRIH